MIENKRVRAVEYLWRDFPELEWQASRCGGDIDGFEYGAHLLVYFDKLFSRWEVRYCTCATLKEAQIMYVEEEHGWVRSQ